MKQGKRAIDKECASVQSDIDFRLFKPNYISQSSSLPPRSFQVVRPSPSNLLILLNLQQLFPQISESLFEAPELHPKYTLSLLTTTIISTFRERVSSRNPNWSSLFDFRQCFPQSVRYLLRGNLSCADDESLTGSFRNRCCFEVRECEILVQISTCLISQRGHIIPGRQCTRACR